MDGGGHARSRQRDRDAVGHEHGRRAIRLAHHDGVGLRHLGMGVADAEHVGLRDHPQHLRAVRGGLQPHLRRDSLDDLQPLLRLPGEENVQRSHG